MGRYTNRRTGIGATVVAGAVMAGLVPTGVSAATSMSTSTTESGTTRTTTTRTGTANAGTAGTGADLRADVDRDGVVDVTGSKDEPAENTWTPARGAIFLANLDDDSRRCPKKDSAGRTLSDKKLQTCNDASDAVVNGATDADDLARLRTLPLPRAQKGTTASLKVTGTGASARTRIFARSGSTWKVVTNKTVLSTAQVRAGVEFGIEARDVVRDLKVWNGQAKVTYTVTDGTSVTRDAVVLRVAPLLTHHTRQKAQQVLVQAGKSETGKQRFVKTLRKRVETAGITKKVVVFGQSDEWVQDWFEPAYTTMPGPAGKPVGLRLMLRSPQNHLEKDPNTGVNDSRAAGKQLYLQLRGPGVGVVEVPTALDRKGDDFSLSSMGNLERIPPYQAPEAAGGERYPTGRVVMGVRSDGSKPSAVLRRLLTAQEGQAPLLLDVSFLSVGHVDEFIQFLPADTARGWRVAVADPDLGVSLLRSADRAGHGKVRLVSKKDSANDLPTATVHQTLASKKVIADNARAAKIIKRNIETVKNETGITDAEIVRVPALYHRDEYGDELVAYLPAAVNGVVLSPTRYLAPQQFGPVVKGKDIFATAVSKAYTKAGFSTAYIDDWDVLHFSAGNVHCGTNVLRAARARWW